ncbi:MAG: glycosyltransferase [Chloroflexi bacterium]|nr:MAG: glycosyltransferase [Chloroflexota bacterium]
MTKLSLVIPALNEEKFLPRLLASLTKQTKQDFEVVVVDGYSKDRTVAAAQAFCSKLPTLNVIVSAKAGLPLQRNLGARATNGEWLVFIDADSVLLPYFIERIEWFIEKQKPVIFTSWFRPDSETSGDALFTLISNSFVEGSIYFHRPIAPGPLTVVRRDVFELAGGYNESLTFGEDYDLTCRVVERGHALQILRETLYEFSLRRVRREGKLRFVRLYATAALRVLLTKRNLEHVPSYVMGGHLYEPKNNLAERSAVHE